MPARSPTRPTRARPSGYSGRFSKKIDYGSDVPTIRRSGSATRITVPHGGIVFHDGGTEVFDSFHHGPVGDLQSLCAALS